MRTGLLLGIMAILLVAACGHKGPLKLPTPLAQTPQAETSSPPTADAPMTGLPPPEPIK